MGIGLLSGNRMSSRGRGQRAGAHSSLVVHDDNRFHILRAAITNFYIAFVDYSIA